MNYSLNAYTIGSFLLCSTAAIAQPGFVQKKDINVIKNSIILEHAWTGGFNCPQFSEMDYNNDGFTDIFVFDRDGERITPLINNGIIGEASFFHAPEEIVGFPTLEKWALMADYNNDLKPDIFSSSNGGIRLYKNTSTDGDTSFELIGVIQTDRGSGPVDLYTDNQDIPAIVDVDNDGDLDIITFSILGSLVEWHENTSTDINNPSFSLADKCWGKFTEAPLDNSVSLNEDCEGAAKINPRHSGSSVLALDLDNDGAKEIILGDASYDNLVMLHNGGSPTEALMDDVDNNFPSYDQSVDLRKFPASFFIDIDNDNKKDLLVAPNARNISENIENVWFYKNNESTAEPNFELTNTELFQDKMIEVGSGALPVLYDYNKDGLQDLFIGNYGYYVEGGNFTSQIAVYKNTGTAEQAEFTWMTDDMGNLSESSLGISLYPCFGDIDNDGIDEMLLGDSNGALHLIEKASNNVENLDFSIVSTPNYQDIDVGSFATPQWFDFDNDNLLDMVVGERSGSLNYYKNVGTVNNAIFELQSEIWGNIDISEFIENTGFSIPQLYKNSDDNIDLIVSSDRGQIFYYKDVNLETDNTFDAVSEKLADVNNGSRYAATIGNLNNDNWPDMIIGNYAGGLEYFEGADPATISIVEQSLQKSILYPNPASQQVRIKTGFNHYEVQLLNVVGQSVLQEISNSNELELSVEHLSTGLYIIQIRAGKYTEQHKLIIE